VLEPSNNSQNNQGEKCFPNSPQQTQGRTVGKCSVLVKTEGTFSFEKKLTCVIFTFVFPPFLF